MTWQLAEKMTGWFIRRGFLAQDDYEVYVYCIDSLLAKIFFYMALMLISLWLGILPVTIWYYLGFTPFRYTAGGYHAKTDLTCVILTWTVYGASMWLIMQSELVPAAWVASSSLVLVLFASAVALRHAPIDHFNKPVSTARKLQMRKWCLVFQVLFILVTLLLLGQHRYTLAFSIALGNGIAALFLLFAYYQKGED